MYMRPSPILVKINVNILPVILPASHKKDVTFRNKTIESRQKAKEHSVLYIVKSFIEFIVKKTIMYIFNYK